MLPVLIYVMARYVSDYKIVAFNGLSPDRVMFSGNSLSNKKL